MDDKAGAEKPSIWQRVNSIEEYWVEYRREEEERNKEIQRQMEEQRKERMRNEEERKRKVKELKDKFFPERPDEKPLSYMLRVMNDPNVPDIRRDEMAKAAAPYLHSRRIPLNERENIDAMLDALNIEELKTFNTLVTKMRAALEENRKSRRKR